MKTPDELRALHATGTQGEWKAAGDLVYVEINGDQHEVCYTVNSPLIVAEHENLIPILDRLSAAEDYAGSQMLHSDYACADDMRAALHAAEHEVAVWRSAAENYIQAECRANGMYIGRIVSEEWDMTLYPTRFAALDAAYGRLGK